MPIEESIKPSYMLVDGKLLCHCEDLDIMMPEDSAAALYPL